MPEQDLETRVANMECALVDINEKLEQLTQQRAANPFSGMRIPRPAAPKGPAAQQSSQPREHAPASAPAFPSIEWFAARGAEWWVGSLGVVFLVIASFLLYQYAVDHEWITPLVRVMTGAIVGGGMFVAAKRFTSRGTAGSEDAIGLREILLGGGIAVWYLTSYAAGVFYHLVSIQTARWLFLALSMIAGWLSLKERRYLLAVLALGVGFAAPLWLLQSSPHSQSVIAHVIYLAPLGALGLTLYLMRGWDLILWITFIGFWVNYPSIVVGRLSSPVASIVASLFAIAFAAAFVRTPILRRRLVAFNADRYGTWSPATHVALWIIPVVSPMIAFGVVSSIWPSAGNEVWGALEVALAIGAYVFAVYENESDATIKHVALTAAAIWSLAGLEWITVSAISRTTSALGPFVLGVAAIHAGFLIFVLREKFFNVPRGFAKLTAVAAVLTVLAFELSGSQSASFQWDWTIAEGLVLGLMAWLWLSLRDDSSEEMYATGVAVLGYGTLLLVLARVLGAVWLPLVTASYAIAGAMLLVVSRRSPDRTLLLRLGALTMVIVVGRLIIVDMSSVETIWRVLLFLACGVAFVGVSYRLQSAPAVPRPESASG